MHLTSTGPHTGRRTRAIVGAIRAQVNERPVTCRGQARRYIDASARGNYDPPAQHEGLTTWCSGRSHTHRIPVRRAHRLSPKGHSPPTATM